MFQVLLATTLLTAFQDVPQQPNVVFTTSQLSKLDAKLVGPDNRLAQEQATKAGYLHADLDGCRLWYPPNTYGLRDARRQSNLMQHLLARGITSGALDPSTLGPEDDRTLRGMFNASDRHDLFHEVAENPGLKLYPGLRTDVHYSIGGSDVVLPLEPHLPNNYRQIATPPVGDPSAQVVIPDDYMAEMPSQTSTYLFPSSINNIKDQSKTKRIINAYFVSIAKEVRQQYESLSGQLIKSGMQMASDTYRAFGERGLDFKSLPETDQRNDALLASKLSPNVFQDPDQARSVLSSAQSKSVQSEFVLGACLIRDPGDGQHWAAVEVVYAQFDCPVGDPVAVLETGDSIPRVVAGDYEFGDPKRSLCMDRSPALEKYESHHGFTFADLPHCRLWYRDDSFGLQTAKKQTALLKSCIDASAISFDLTIFQQKTANF